MSTSDNASEKHDTENIYELFMKCFVFSEEDFSIDIDSASIRLPLPDQGENIKWLSTHWMNPSLPSE